MIFLYAFSLAAVHWSVMTITSIGYGDITPVNKSEYGLCAGMMFLSGFAWAIIIGELCGIFANGNEVMIDFHKNNDDMNLYMQQEMLPTKVRLQVREYLKRARDAKQVQASKAIIGNLNLKLAGQMYLKERWVKKRMVPWTRKAPSAFIAKLIINMTCQTFPAQDCLPGANRMFVLRAGVIFTDTLITMSSRTTVWNYDFMLFNPILKTNHAAQTLTYVIVEYLEKDFFMKTLEEGWEETKAIKKSITWLAVLRGLQFMAVHNGMLPNEFVQFQKEQAEKERPTRERSNRQLLGNSLGSEVAAKLLSTMQRIEGRLDGLELQVRSTTPQKTQKLPAIGAVAKLDWNL